MQLKQLAESTKRWEDTLNKTTVIHITDIHIHGGSDPALKRLDGIYPILRPVLVSAKNVAIVLSGDIAYSGTKAEYDAILPRLKKLEVNIADGGTVVEWIVVPGNHDGKFKPSSKARLAIIDGQTCNIHFHATRRRDEPVEHRVFMTGGAAADAIERYWHCGCG